MLKKFASVAIVGLLLTAGIAPTQAATVKQGTACAKTGAKTKVGSTSYTCGVNPGTTSTKLVWVTAECISAGKEYADSVKQMAGFQSQVQNVQNQLNSSIKSFQDVLTQYQTQASAAETADYVVGKTHDASGVATDVTVTGRLAAIDAINARITETTNNIPIIQAGITDLNNQITALGPQKDAALVKKASAIAELPALQTQLATATTTLTGLQVEAKKVSDALKAATAPADKTVLTTAALKMSTALNTWAGIVTKWKNAIISKNSEISGWQKTADQFDSTKKSLLSKINSSNQTIANAQTGIKKDQKLVTTLTNIPADFQKKIDRTQAQITSLNAKLVQSNDTKTTILASVKDNATQAKTLRTVACKAGL